VIRKNFGTLRHRPTGRQGPELRVTRAASVLTPLESTLLAFAEEHGEPQAGLLARTLIDPARVFLVKKPTDHHVGFVLLSAFHRAHRHAMLPDVAHKTAQAVGVRRREELLDQLAVLREQADVCD
jgi:hypothetical protein